MSRDPSVGVALVQAVLAACTSALRRDEREEKLVALIDHLMPTVQAAVARVLHGWGRPQDVPDVSQAVFLKLLHNDMRLLRDWEHERASLECYFGTIARNTAIDHVRSKCKEVPIEESRIEEDGGEPGLDQIVQIKDEARKILHAIRAAFSPLDSYLFEALVMLERDYEELALETGLSVGNLQVKKHRLIKRARTIAAQVR